MTSGAAAHAAQLPGDNIRLTADGRIVDFLDPETTRPNTPEERVRQVYAQKLHFDYGYPKDEMVLNAPLNIGSRTVFADIAIYQDAVAAKQRDQGKIRFIVETKAPDVTSGVAQLKSYVFSTSAEGGVWMNESDAPKYFRRVDVPKRKLDEWPNIPREGETWDGIGLHTKSNLRAPHNLVETFRRCHNALYKVGIDSEDLAMDMVRIILAKYQDELNEGETCEFRVTPMELQTIDGRKRVAGRVKSLFAQVRGENRDVFDEHEAITAGDREIATVVSELQDFRFVPDEESDDLYDVVGAAYEVYVGAHLKGDRGQYFTHRLIVRLLVRMLDPGEKDTIFDPAMGSGGFLIAAMRHVTHKIMQTKRSRRAKESAVHALHRRIFGIDKSPKLVKVARTNMILASDGHSGLRHGDTLEPPRKLPAEFRKNAGPGVPTVILTNPPFGATSEHKITAARDPEIVSQFEVGHVWRPTGPGGELRPTEELSAEGTPPEDLFVERCLKWVAPGGRIGIVVPRGLLDNEKALPVRTLIFDEARVLAAVNCHDDTFKPNTNAKAAMLLLEKKTPGERDHDYPIFMAISQGIGHNAVGDPVYRTDAVGDVLMRNGEPILDEDTAEVFEGWLAHCRGDSPPSEWYYTIRRSDISDNLSLNPVRYLPQYERSRQKVLELGETDGWTVERLGQIAQVFNGPRFKRPYADKGITDGPGIVRYFTGNAITQTRGENVKYLDLNKAKPEQRRMIDKLYLERGMILVTDSGTVGRVAYATHYHEGAVGTNNLIRIVIDDLALRGYVYQFLCSKLGQDQLKANIYGAIVEHVEPAEAKNILVPIPEDRELLKRIGLPVIRSMELQEHAYIALEDSGILLADALDEREEDDDDLRIARKRLKEIASDPSNLVSGNELQAMLEELTQ